MTSESCLLLVAFLVVFCHCFGRAPGWCQGPVGANWATVSRRLGKHSSWLGPSTKPCRGGGGGGERGAGGFPFTVAWLLFSRHTHCAACQTHMQFIVACCLSAKSSNTSRAQSCACKRELPAEEERRNKKLLAAAQETSHYTKSDVFTAQLPAFTFFIQGCTSSRAAHFLNHSHYKKPTVSAASVKAG